MWRTLVRNPLSGSSVQTSFLCQNPYKWTKVELKIFSKMYSWQASILWSCLLLYNWIIRITKPNLAGSGHRGLETLSRLFSLNRGFCCLIPPACWLNLLLVFSHFLLVWTFLSICLLLCTERTGTSLILQNRDN